MKQIRIEKYKPYDYIPLTDDAVLNSLKTNNIVLQAFRIIPNSETIKHISINKKSRPVVIFGELEWMMLTMV